MVDDFDDIDKLRLKKPLPPLPASVRKKARQAKRAARQAVTWAQIPHKRGLELAKRIGIPALAVLLVLEQAIHATGSNRVKLTNGVFERYGISAQSKSRGLRQLAAAGVITIEQNGKTAPIVTYYWYTKHGKLRI